MQRESRRAWLLATGIVALTLVAYAPLARNAFVRIDDPEYITNNPPVLAGLTRAGIARAFQIGYAANWHPLTWLSHMLDVSLWGLDARGHHATSLALHAASAVLLFLFLRRALRAELASAFVAVVFAVHPLHVESVAWAAERKDVLSTLLGFASLLLWVDWAEKKDRVRYFLSLAAFAASLAAKPMLVTLPLLLLFLDRWAFFSRPLRIREKIPFFALAFASCVVTLIAQERGQAINTMENVPLAYRFGNAASAYFEYARKAFWPTDLAVFYPFPPGGAPASKVVSGVALLLAGSSTALATSRRWPWFSLGWWWWLVTLLPVIGIVQVGGQAMADRYMYVPLLGLAIVVAFGVRAALSTLGSPRTLRGVVTTGAVAAAGACVFATRTQVEVWKDDMTLFQHAASVTEGNYVAHFRLGFDLGQEKRFAEALPHYEAAIRFAPEMADAHNDYGAVLMNLGRVDESIVQFAEAARLQPQIAMFHFNLASALLDRNRVAEAIGRLEEGLRLEPGNEFRRRQLEEVRRGLPTGTRR